MRYLKIVAAAAVIVISVAGLGAQKMLLNQAYLNQFPTIDRVRAETKGSDPVDSLARYMAALEVINDFLIHDLITAPNGGEFDMPPAADRVHYRYSNELTKLGIDAPEPPSKDPRFRPLRDKYEKDPAFTDMLLLKFFTPQFRSDYYAWTRKPIPAASATRSGSVSTAADPSIGAATAAKVDLSLFAGSIKFGEPINLPSCPYQRNFLGVPIRADNAPDCLETSELSGDVAAAVDIINTITNTKPTAPDPDLHVIYLSEAHRPSWMFGETVSVRTFQGGIVRVVINTRGRAVEARAAAELRAKYGLALLQTEGKITPDVGNAFVVHDLEWFRPGLHVEYKVLVVDDDGRVTVNGQGFVRIETDSAYKRRTAEEKKAPKNVL